MDEETQKKVEAKVLEILRGSDLESVVRNAAADRLGIDLSLKDRRLFVHRVVEDYLHSLSQEDEQQQQQGGAGGDDKGKQEEEEEVRRPHPLPPVDQEEGDAARVPGQDAGVDPRVLVQGRQGATHPQRDKFDSRAVGSSS